MSPAYLIGGMPSINRIAVSYNRNSIRQRALILLQKNRCEGIVIMNYAPKKTTSSSCFSLRITIAKMRKFATFFISIHFFLQ